MEYRISYKLDSKVAVSFHINYLTVCINSKHKVGSATIMYVCVHKTFSAQNLTVSNLLICIVFFRHGIASLIIITL